LREKEDVDSRDILARRRASRFYPARTTSRTSAQQVVH
jgi:hypothetical protein